MDEQSWQEVPDDTSTENFPTPATTHSTVSESMPLRGNDMQKDNDSSHMEFQPRDNGPLLIRTRQKPHLFLSVCYGVMRLLPTPAGGSYWRCVKKQGWFGLRSTVSGRYISRDEKGQIAVSGRRVGYFECFTDCRDPNGGYILKQLERPSSELKEMIISSMKLGFFSNNTEHLANLLDQCMRHSHELMEVSISEDGKSLVHQKTGGTAWDFIETKYMRQSTWLQCPGIQPEEL
jgi:hypothetical protein